MADKLKKGDTVFYTARADTVRAVVVRVHRDGSVTVEAKFAVDAAGKDRAGYLGFHYRPERADLRRSA